MSTSKHKQFRFLAVPLMLVALMPTSVVVAATPLETVDWAPDGAVDGMGSGTFGSINVSYTTTIGGNSGTSFATNWDASLATNDAVGDGATNLEAGILGVIGGTQVQTIQFDQSIIDPILLINFGTDVMSFDFGSLIIALLDNNNAALAGNIVSFSGASNSANDGFALQIVGGFGPTNPLQFIMKSTKLAHNSVGFTLSLTLTPDSDGDDDGVPDNVDACPNSVPDNIVLNPNQYAQNIIFGAFEVGPNNDQSIVYDMTTTNGCTCKEIVAALGAGKGHLKKGCSPSLMEEFTGVSANPDRKAGIGKKAMVQSKDEVSLQNHPNPFNPSTTITFAVPEAGEVTLAIYNLRGQLIQTLHSGPIAAGQHSVVWNGTDFRGAKVASGVYVYKLQAKDFVATKKLVFTK